MTSMMSLYHYVYSSTPCPPAAILRLSKGERPKGTSLMVRQAHHGDADRASEDLAPGSQIQTAVRSLTQPAGSGCRVNPAFPRRIQEVGGPNLSRCYQCLTCTLGCPVASEMDYQPHALVRMAQLGLSEQVLSSRTIWLCAGCETCATRCPNDIQIVKLMDALRQMALREGIQPTEPAVATFHRTFLAGIRRWGRQYELGMMLVLKVRTRDLFSDIGLGIKMLFKGKLPLLPHRGQESKEVKTIFHRPEKDER